MKDNELRDYLRTKIKCLNEDITLNISSNGIKRDIYITYPSIYTCNIEDLEKHKDNLEKIIKELKNAI